MTPHLATRGLFASHLIVRATAVTPVMLASVQYTPNGAAIATGSPTTGSILGSRL